MALLQQLGLDSMITLQQEAETPILEHRIESAFQSSSYVTSLQISDWPVLSKPTPKRQIVRRSRIRVRGFDRSLEEQQTEEEALLAAVFGVNWISKGRVNNDPRMSSYRQSTSW